MSTVALILAAFAFGAACADETTTTNNRPHRQSDVQPPIYGVATVAGVTSRNGRVSTTGGIHFYPASDRAITTSNGYYSPLSFSKAINDKYASGSIQIQPGVLGVSSSAQSGFAEPGFNPWSVKWPSQRNRWTSQDSQWTRQDNQWPSQDNQWTSQDNEWTGQDNQWPVPDHRWPLQNQFYAPISQRRLWYDKLNFDPQATDVTRWLYPSFNHFLNLWR